uniref:P-type ATPase N-terminal domain-containing protein n=1 Tax=Oryzias latipes TaxID=8090 RepID=A0A3B3IP89_ORYLA
RGGEEDVYDQIKKPSLNRSYQSNKIRTTKYSFLSFLPKNLFEQLHRIANVYFIFLAALNFVPVVEAFQPEVSLVPIVLVLSVTAIKDVFEDFRRFHSDRLVNRQLCDLYSR